MSVRSCSVNIVTNSARDFVTAAYAEAAHHMVHSVCIVPPRHHCMLQEEGALPKPSLEPPSLPVAPHAAPSQDASVSCTLSTPDSHGVELPGNLRAEMAVAQAEDQQAAAKTWKNLLGSMKPIPCPGHGEPCVIRQVKKKGPNNGRLFYCCARNDGPPPEGRCDFFSWIKRGQRKM